MQMKQTIVRLQKQNKSIREIARALGVAKSTVWYILRKKERTGELRNIKRHGCPQRTPVVDDRRILSMVKKNTFTTSSQEKYTLQEVGLSLSKSTIKRRLHESKYRRFKVQGTNKARLDFAKKHLKKPDHFWKIILWTAEIKINLSCTRMTGRKKYGDGLERLMHTTSSVKHGGAV